MRRFNKSDVIGVESVAEENLVDGAGEVGLGQEKAEGLDRGMVL